MLHTHQFLWRKMWKRGKLSLVFFDCTQPVHVNRAAVNTHDGPSAYKVDVLASRWQAACAPMVNNVGKIGV